MLFQLKYMKSIQVEKGGSWKSNVLTLLDNCGNYYLILYHNLTSSSFLKVQYGIWSHIRELFLLCYIEIHWSVLHLGELLPMPICNITYWSFGKYQFTELCRSSKCWHILSNNENPQLLVSPHSSSEKPYILGICQAQSTWW